MEISANKFLESACKYYDNIAVNEFKLLTNEIGNNTGKYIIFISQSISLNMVKS